MAWIWRSFWRISRETFSDRSSEDDHAAHEAQVRRQQLLPVVHDEDALDVEREAAVAALAVVQVEGRLRRDVEQRARLEAALHVHAEVLERVVPVVGDVLVELAVLVLGDLVLGAGPDRLHRVERLALQANRVRHEVGVALDDVLAAPAPRV